MVIGGRESGSNAISINATSSIKMVGFDNCSVPDLPEARYHHGSFVTSWGSLAVCGGWWDGKPASSDCLVALRDDEAVYWVSIGHYEAVAVGN